MPRGITTLLRSTKGSRRPSSRQPSRARQDIQGLRAIAVLAVVADHLLGYPHGGFVGVDVFFVISGFLITGQLIREHQKHGQISFADFYKRRVRRIMPAATLTLGATLLVAYFLYAAGRFHDTFVDGIWALVFTANWRFASAGTDYMNADGPVSPLQHFWSLAVEEQFYVVWPILIVVALGLAARASLSTRRATTLLGAIMTGLVLISFVFALWESKNNATVAYFSTLSRAWELGVGALLAIFAGAFASIPSHVRPILGYLGFAGIVASIFLIGPDTAFPGPGAAGPVLATALVIAAGTGGEQRFLYPLTNPIMGYIGNISYSLYLWHFPTLILLESFFSELGVEYYLYSLALMTVLSMLSFHCIEQPVLHSKWLNPNPNHERPTQRDFIMGAPRQEFVVLATSVGLLAAGFLGIAAYAQSRPTYEHLADGGVIVAEPKVVGGDPASAPEETPPRQQDILASLSATSFPELSPSVDNLESDRVPQWTENGCLDVTPANKDLCVYGAMDGERTAVLLGDSKGTSYLPGIIEALEPQGYSVHSFTMNQCPAADVRIHQIGQVDDYTECTEHREWALDEIGKLNPDLIIFSNTSSLDRLMSGATAVTAGEEILEGMSATIARLPDPSKLVILGPPPNSGNLQECATRVSNPDSCEKEVNSDWVTLQQAESRAAEEAGAKYVDPRPWFCSPTNRCPAFIGTTPVHVDGGHLTTTYSASLAPELAAALVGDPA